MELSISYPQWEQALTDIGWGSPYPLELWTRLGGGDSLMLEKDRVYSLTASLGWSPEHANRLWSAVESASSPLSPPPLTPVAKADTTRSMPWESTPAPEPAEQKSSKKISLPKHSGLDLSLAPKRLAASLVDGLFFLASLLAVCQLGKLPVAAALGQQGPGDLKLQLLLTIVTVTAVMLLYFSWSMRRPAHPGQSLGKQALALRVVCSDGSPVSPRQVLLREGFGVVLAPWVVAWGLDMALWPLGLLAAASFLVASLLGLGLADRIAKTKVIKA